MATPDEIRAGKITDVYFLRGRDVLRAEGENPHVVAEIRTSTFGTAYVPRNLTWVRNAVSTWQYSAAHRLAFQVVVSR